MRKKGSIVTVFPEDFVKAYIDEYSKEAPRDRSLYAGPDAYLAECLHTYEQCIAGRPLEEQVSKWIALIRSPASLGFRLAFAADDASMLNDVLYQVAAIRHLRAVRASGYDHCMHIWSVLDALAAGMAERVALHFLEDMGMSSNGFRPMVVMTNLVMALLYRRSDFEHAALADAERFCKTKQTALDTAAVRYLAALVEGDVAQAGMQLGLYCGSVPRVKDFGVSKLDKMFWPRAQGLYNLAYAVWDADKAAAIPMPEAPCFAKGLAAWQSANGFKPGRLFLEFPPPMELANKVLTTTPPACSNYQPYLDSNGRNRKQFHENAALFKAQLIEKILAEL
jgi:hypothetical protein